MILQNFNSTNLQSEKLSDDDVPSAPPFCGATQEIKQDDEISPSRVHRTPHATASSEFKTTPGRKQEGNIENGNLGQFVRSVYYLSTSLWENVMQCAYVGK